MQSRLIMMKPRQLKNSDFSLAARLSHCFPFYDKAMLPMGWHEKPTKVFTASAYMTLAFPFFTPSYSDYFPPLYRAPYPLVATLASCCSCSLPFGPLQFFGLLSFSSCSTNWPLPHFYFHVACHPIRFTANPLFHTRCTFPHPL